MIPEGRRDVLSPDSGRLRTAAVSRTARLVAARAARVLPRGDIDAPVDRPRDFLEDR